MGFVGPHTNCGLPVQTLDAKNFPDAFNPAGRQRIVHLLAIAKHPEIVPSGALSGFCLMITRECFTAIGDLDESYPGGGFTDNDWQLRGQDAGFLGLLAPRSFVYHVGHVSMDKFTPGHKGGVENIQHHLRKWRKPGKKFLTVCYRVQINNALDFDLFRESLEKSAEIADACVILDDRSKTDIFAEIHSENGQLRHLKKWVKGFSRNPNDLEFNEARDRNALIDLARSTHPDWIINLDHDETLDDRVTRADFDVLMNPVDPAIKCYVFSIFTFWRGKTHVRLDDVWGTMTLSTLFKNDPCWGGVYQMTANSTFHCRRVPTYIPGDALSPTKRITVKHYGYSDYDKCVAKRAYYVANDQDKLEKLVGNTNYEHLTDETQLTLLPYSSSKLAVAMLARDEEFDVARQLRMWSNFADEVLIVDTGSTDGTVQFANDMGATVLQYRCCDKATDPNHLICDFAAARNFAIENTKSDFVLMVDPDEEFDQYSAAILPKTLLAQADGYRVEIQNMTPEGKPYRTYQPRLFRNDPRIRYAARSTKRCSNHSRRTRNSRWSIPISRPRTTDSFASRVKTGNGRTDATPRSWSSGSSSTPTTRLRCTPWRITSSQSGTQRTATCCWIA
jgi:glycosyltransferase involved in cell wall biosynthesis